MRLQFLQEDIGRNLEDNIRHKENGQCSVVFSSCLNVQVLLQPQNRRITDVNTAKW
jgi:hypothetical protein